MNEDDRFICILVIMLIFINLIIPLDCKTTTRYDNNKCERYLNKSCIPSPSCNCELNGLIKIYDDCSLLKKVIIMTNIIIIYVSLMYVIDLYKNKGGD